MSNTEILELIKSNFPYDSQLREDKHQENGSLIVYIHWTLDDDPDRPSKPSKTIKLNISDDIIVLNMNPHVEQCISNYIQNKLKSFDPNHNAEKYEAPPLEDFGTIYKHNC